MSQAYIKIITQKDCPHCEELKSLLNSNHIKYDETYYSDLVSNKDTKTIYILKNRKIRTTPVVLIYVDDWLVDCFEPVRVGKETTIRSINNALSKALST